MKLGLITPTRGNERADFVKQAARLIQRQTRQPDAWYLIDYPPKDDGVDMIPRLNEGLRLAREDKITHVAFWEDDDYYRPDYLANMCNYLTEDTDMLGARFAPTYHLQLRRWGLYETLAIGTALHRSIASVSFASTYLSAEYLSAHDIRHMWWVDHYLWQKARTPGSGARVFRIVDTELFDCVTIKHGVGKCCTADHKAPPKTNFTFTDPKLYYLQKFTGEDFAFYEEQSRLLRGEVLDSI